MSVCYRVLVVVAVIVGSVPTQALATSTSAAQVVVYEQPVDAPVLDTYRPPDQQWQAGNRGWEYAVVPGVRVGSAGGGVVAFAGSIAGTNYVSVQHPDGLRTTYSWLAQIEVVQGQVVNLGQRLGTTSDRIHFGVKRGSQYLDPATLFATASAPPRLVPLVDDVVRVLGERRWRSAVGFVGRFGFGV